MIASTPKTQILGISFFTGSLNEAIELTVQKGGLLVAPAAPALIHLPHDDDYRKALEDSDIVITDSTLMVGLWNLWKSDRLGKISGYRFLKALLDRPEIQDNSLWIMPSTEEAKRNQTWIKQAKGYTIRSEHIYIAPLYDQHPIEDPALLQLIKKYEPRFIINNLGGGTQEKLGFYLKQHLSYSPAIICTGAALAFFAGGQAEIPNWADRCGLGWLFRCIADPKKFVPRYLSAFKLIPLMFKYGENSPAQ